MSETAPDADRHCETPKVGVQSGRSPDLIAELAALLREAGVTPRLYGEPVDMVAFRDDLRNELGRTLGGELVSPALLGPVQAVTQRVVERHIEAARAARADRLALLAALSCDHSAMAECHPGCGHFACPCGISWDEGAGR